MNSKGAAPSGDTFDAHRAAMGEGNMLDYRQPEAGAALGAIARFVDPIKALKESGQMMGFDAAAGVGNRNDNFGGLFN